ncbi:hypothetical protein Hanom_Chr06g00551481 [Helianthus anomalus]
MGSGQNGFGSERVRVETGFRSERVSGRSGWLKNVYLKRLYIKGQFCRVEMGPGWFGLSTDQYFLTPNHYYIAIAQTLQYENTQLKIKTTKNKKRKTDLIEVHQLY